MDVACTASNAEKNATPSAATTSARQTENTPRLRSCVICRHRKVKCDKTHPCGNCVRANIECVRPSSNRPPRWARNLGRLAAKTDSPGLPTEPSTAEDVASRLRSLQTLVNELTEQLEEAKRTAGLSGSVGATHPTPASSTERHDHPSPATDVSSASNHLGRLVVQDSQQSRYVAGGFWSRIDDEIESLNVGSQEQDKNDHESSEDDPAEEATANSHGPENPASSQYSFLFRSSQLNQSKPSLSDLAPMTSQVPFLVEVFSENVNRVIHIVHMPSLTEIIRNARIHGNDRLPPSQMALLFSIYYSAVTSMDASEVLSSFGTSQADLCRKYRLGMECSLSDADFLNFPNILLIQALALFLFLARRSESPRFIWMMTGFVIRMAQYLGLHRDGANFEHFTPFEIEIRRRLWWNIYALEMRASEDQGTDLTISDGSFDTKIPININDSDLHITMKEAPQQRVGATDMSWARTWIGICEISRQITRLEKDNSVESLKRQTRLVSEIYERFEQEYLNHAAVDEVYRTAVVVARLVMARLTLMVFLQVLFSPPDEIRSDDIQMKLLLSAIEVAEYNHVLHAERQFQRWRWVYQTYTHWHSIIYLLIEVSRREWSPLMERAWTALHSKWLIPTEGSIAENLRIWVPLRRLKERGHRHREAELNRLRADPRAASLLEEQYWTMPVPSSPGPFSPRSSVEGFRDQWRQLLGELNTSLKASHAAVDFPSTRRPIGFVELAFAGSTATPENTNYTIGRGATGYAEQPEIPISRNENISGHPDGSDLQANPEPYPSFLDNDFLIPDLPDKQMQSTDLAMEIDDNFNWYHWLEAARNMEWGTEQVTTGWPSTLS